MKEMNKRVLFGKVATIRDAQLVENRQLEQEFLDREVKLEAMMEIERLKFIRDEEQREARRFAARKSSKEVLVEQIKEKHQQRVKE